MKILEMADTAKCLQACVHERGLYLLRVEMDDSCENHSAFSVHHILIDTDAELLAQAQRFGWVPGEEFPRGWRSGSRVRGFFDLSIRPDMRTLRMFHQDAVPAPVMESLAKAQAA